MNEHGSSSKPKHKADKRFAVEYEYAGVKWCADLWADDWEDARRKLRAMAHGEIVGSDLITGNVPSPIARILGWFGIK